MPRKINHWRRVKSFQPTTFSQLEPGMVIRFRYNNNKVYDKNPLCLYLWRDRKNKLIHTINLNYMYESKVQKMFAEIDKITSVVEVKGGVHDEEHTKTLLSTRGSDSAKSLYDKVIKSKILPEYDAYRTYKINKIRSVQLIEYDVKGKILK
tara:strand:+ start:1842 stop:2294 length:453 start_codon:yes stop_codon:yes gene_type:complete